MNDGRERITALIPAYQEGPRIAAVVEAVARHLPVVVVDDGSTDDTAERAESAGATVLRQVPNAGKGAALRAGFRDALAAGSIAVVTLDADGQHDPAEIPAFLAVFARTPARVDRRAAGFLRDAAGTAGVERPRRSRRVRGARPGRARQPVRLSTDRPRAHAGDARQSDESGFEFEVEMIARCIALGLPIDWVPIRTIYAGEPSHIRPWRHFTEFLRVTRKARRIARGLDG